VIYRSVLNDYLALDSLGYNGVELIIELISTLNIDAFSTCNIMKKVMDKFDGLEKIDMLQMVSEQDFIKKQECF